MSQFSVKATFDGADLVKGFKDVKKEVEGIETAGEDAKKSLDQMLQQKNSSSNYRRQLMQITQQLTDLTVNYRRLSDEEKQSEFGIALSQRIDELTAKASEFKDAMLDVQQSISESASDTANWDALQQLIDISTSSLQTFAGVAGLSEESVEGLTRTIAAMQTIGAASNAVIKIGNALQKQSALMLGVRRAQELAAATAIKLRTAAEVKGKAATVATTVAQKALNTAAKANPYVLLAAVILTAGVAIYKFAKNSNEAKEAELKHKEALEKAAEAAQNWRDKVSKAIEGPLSKYKLLAAEYKTLKNTHEKNKWINDNKDAFEELGLSIDSLKSAEDAFVNNTGNVVQALIKRATAAAKQQQLTELAAKYMDAKLRGEQEYASKQKKAGDEVNSSSHSTASGDEYVDRTGKWVYTEQGAQKANATIKKSAMAEANYLMEQLDKLASEIAAEMPETTLKKPTTTTSTSTTSVDEDIYGKDSLRAAQIEVQKLQDQLNRMGTTSPEFESTKQALFAAEKKVKDIQDLMKQPSIAKTLVEQYDDAAKKINGIVKEYNIGIIDEETAKTQIEAINAELQKLGLKPIEIKLKPDVDKVEDNVVKKGQWDGAFDKDNDTKTAVDSVVKAYSLKLIDKDYAQEAIDAINIDRINAGLPPIHLNLDVEGVKEGIGQAMQMFDTVGSLGNVVSSINSVYESFKNLPNAMDEAENGWERFMVGFEAGMQIMNVFTTVLGTINTVMETFTMIQELVTAAKLKDATASGVKAGADTAAATAATAEATADSAAATASGTKAAADTAAATASTALATADSAATAASGTKAATDIATAAASGTKAAADTAAATAATAAATADSAGAAASGTKAATDIAGAAASGTKAAADMTAAGAATAEATANTASAVSGAAKSVSWLPIVGPILAVAAIAAVIGGIIAAANKGKFASGGIVPGPSKIGDFNIARVNGGEMILNNRQQANLFNMLDHNRVNNISTSPQNVSFRIQGDTLVGVIDNYNKKRSRM